MKRQHRHPLITSAIRRTRAKGMKRVQIPTDSIPWYLILFGNLRYGFSDAIRLFSGASIIMWVQLADLMLGATYYAWDAPETKAIQLLGLAPQDSMIIRRCIRQFSHLHQSAYIIPKILEQAFIEIKNKWLTIATQKRMVVKYRNGSITTGNPSGIEFFSHAFRPLTCARFDYLGGIMVEVNYLGLFELNMGTINTLTFIPTHASMRSIGQDLVDEHLVHLVTSCIDSIKTIDKFAHVQTNRILSSGHIELNLDYHMEDIAYRLNAMEHDTPLEPNEFVDHVAVQKLLVFLTRYHRTEGAVCPSFRVLLCFIPFIESIVRTTLVRNASLHFNSPIPSTPWTIALAYFLVLPVPTGFHPIVDAFSVHQPRSAISIVWNSEHLSDLIQILEWWSSTCNFLPSLADQLPNNPLHSEYNFYILNAVCSTIFVNLYRSLVVGMVEPYVDPHVISRHAFDLLRKRNVIFDFDEFSNMNMAQLYQPMTDTLTNNPFIVEQSETGVTYLKRLSTVFNRLCDTLETPSSNMSYASGFDFHFPIDLTHMSGDMNVVANSKETTFRSFIKSLLSSGFTIMDVPYPYISTDRMLFVDLELYIDVHGKNEQLKLFLCDDAERTPLSDGYFGELYQSMENFILDTSELPSHIKQTIRAEDA